MEVGGADRRATPGPSLGRLRKTDMVCNRAHKTQAASSRCACSRWLPTGWIAKHVLVPLIPVQHWARALRDVFELQQLREVPANQEDGAFVRTLLAAGGRR